MVLCICLFVLRPCLFWILAPCQSPLRRNNDQTLKSTQTWRALCQSLHYEVAVDQTLQSLCAQPCKDAQCSWNLIRIALWWPNLRIQGVQGQIIPIFLVLCKILMSTIQSFCFGKPWQWHTIQCACQDQQRSGVTILRFFFFLKNEKVW